MDHSSEGNSGNSNKEAAKRPAHDSTDPPSRRLKQPPSAEGVARIQQQPPPQQAWSGDYPYPSSSAAAAAGQPPLPQEALAYQQPNEYYATAGGYPPAATVAVAPQLLHPPQSAHFLQPKQGRLPADRPLMKLSVSLIDTYKSINTIYYEERDARMKKVAREKGKGPVNNGWDDENYDYVVTPGEMFFDRYKIKERIGKGSFGQVVRAEDTETKTEVAIKIIKSKKPFALQAKTEIELLTHLLEKDPDDQHNIGKFIQKMHACLRLRGIEGMVVWWPCPEMNTASNDLTHTCSATVDPLCIPWSSMSGV